MLLLIYAAPLVLSAVALFVELRHFFHKTALVISLAPPWCLWRSPIPFSPSG